MKFEFGKYTEITDLVFELSPEKKEEYYIRFFICTDTHDYWYVRVLEGINEQYEFEDGVYLLERNNIGKAKGETLNINKVKKIILEDDGSNWDVEEYRDLGELIEAVDGGFGINNLKES